MGFWQNIFYNKSIRRLRQMLESLRMRDYSLQYSTEKMSGEERRLTEEINSVLRDFRESEHRHQGELHFYNALLSKVDSILIATDNDGRVRWLNNAAIESLFGFKFESIEQLEALHPTLPGQLKKLRNKSRELISFTMPNGEERQYAASLTNIFVNGLCYRLYTLQSVATILKQGEIQAQQRLIRVLTHEIMNSLTPIISLSDTLSENITQSGANGLMQFVQRYRRLSGIAAPAIRAVGINSFIQGIKELFPQQQNIFFDIECGDRMMQIDPSQMEQVLINLLKNAIETRATRITVTAKTADDGHWLILSVEDNGGGFSAEVSENIFTPFFSTKQDGEGVGLAVCRQIVCNHGGHISAECVNGGARFTVRLPLNR